MQILGHVSVFDGILGGFLRRINRRVQLAELVREAHAHFEGVGHDVAVSLVSWLVLGKFEVM